MKMDKIDNQMSISEEILCLVCFEVPSDKIFQCINGHTICSDCCKNVHKCPHCDLPYYKGKIRNRALESILEKLRIVNKYKPIGSNLQQCRRHVSSQVKKWGTEIRLCQQIGYACPFVINTNNIKAAEFHLQEKHNSKVVTKAIRRFVMTGVDEDGRIGVDRKTWSPAIVHLHGDSFLLLVTHNWAKASISIHFVITSGDIGQHSSKFMAEYRIKSERPDECPNLQWSAPPISIHHVMPTIKDPVFRLPEELWKYYRNKNGNIAFDISIHKTSIS